MYKCPRTYVTEPVPFVCNTVSGSKIHPGVQRPKDSYQMKEVFVIFPSYYCLDVTHHPLMLLILKLK